MYFKMLSANDGHFVLGMNVLNQLLGPFPTKTLESGNHLQNFCQQSYCKFIWNNFSLKYDLKSGFLTFTHAKHNFGQVQTTISSKLSILFYQSQMKMEAL